MLLVHSMHLFFHSQGTGDCLSCISSDFYLRRTLQWDTKVRLYRIAGIVIDDTIMAHDDLCHGIEIGIDPRHQSLRAHVLGCRCVTLKIQEQYSDHQFLWSWAPVFE